MRTARRLMGGGLLRMTSSGRRAHLQTRGDGLMTYLRKALPLLLAVIAIVGLTACGSGDDSDTTTTATTPAADKESPAKADHKAPAVPTIVIRNGEPVGGVDELEYDAGDQIRFRVSSNRADEVHVHGYDVEEEIPAGGTATLSFPADIEGIFEVELHGSEAQIAELRVNP
jgi:major membrane immunogen (membrane-anchored lipoprotein)